MASRTPMPRGFRPTRRDLLVVILTFTVAYIFLTAPERQRTANTGSRLKSLLGGAGSDQCAPEVSGLHDRTFSEQNKKVGFKVVGDDEPGLTDEEEADDYAKMETKMLGHTPGWTMFEKLYLFNGQFWVLTDKRSDWPELRLLTSTGLPANNEPGNEAAREPKGDELLFVAPKDAAKQWGDNVYEMSGMTWLFNDGQFIDHYYHFAAELLLGVWRVHATQDPNIDAYGHTSLTPPNKAWFLHQDHIQWRDRPRFNPTIMYGLFPNIALMFPEDMNDLRDVTRSDFRKKAFVFERAILADRSAAFRGPYTGPTSRTVAGATAFGTASRWWWEPVRRQVLRFSGVPDEIIDRNLEGYGAVDPVKWEKGGEEEGQYTPLAPIGKYRPVVTYISRQSSRRRLTPESHADLVKALEERAKKLDFELIIVEAERLTKEEQFAIAGKTTIMLGVHGNGLSHLLWMPATPRSAVIEMFYHGGFARDYQWTAHALGMRHFAVQHDKYFTAPNEPKVNYPEGFQGSKITVVGKVVADIIEERLAMRI